MPTKKESTSNNKPKENISDAHVNRNDVKSGFHEKQQIDNSHETRQNNKGKKMTLLGYFKKKESQPIIANIVSIVAVIISGILAVFTYYLYHIASGQVESVVKAGNAAQSSAITAQNTLQETKLFNTKYLKLQTDAFDKANVDAIKRDKLDKENSDRQKQSVNAQIAALRETQKEFEVENKPFLGLVNLKIDTPIKGKVKVYFTVFNYGKQPAKVIYMKRQVYYAMADFDADTVKNTNYIKINIGEYMSNGVSEQIDFQDDFILPSYAIDQIKKSERYIYIIGFCEYINPVNDKKFRFKFNYRIRPYPENSVDNIYAITTEVKI